MQSLTYTNPVIGNVINNGLKFFSGNNQMTGRAEDTPESGTQNLEHSSQNKNWLGSLVDFGRSIAKFVVKHNPITEYLDSVHKSKLADAMAKAKSRNSASNDNEIKDYHDSIKFDYKTGRGLFDYHRSSKQGAKPLVILFMGNGQKPNDSKDEAGVIKLYNKLKQDDDCDVLLCTVGSAQAALKLRWGLSDDTSLDPQLVKQHMFNMIEDRNKSRGMFIGEAKPSEVIQVGYSWGAGLKKLSQDRWHKLGNNTKIALSVSWDGIMHGIHHIGDELVSRPQHSLKHISIFQNNDYLLNGSAASVARAGDETYRARDIANEAWGHDEIDDCNKIIGKIYHCIQKQINTRQGLAQTELYG